jgi:hypothetical protein
MTKWLIVYNFHAGIEWNFLERWKVVVWSMKMVLIPCINIVYSLICLKIFLVIYNEVMNESIYCHGKCEVSNFLNRLVYGGLGFAPALKI